MKLLRVGNKGKEKPAVINKDGKIIDLSSIINDFNPDNLNHSTINKIKNLNLLDLPEIQEKQRIGACVSNPGKFIGIGLNYSDHAAETGANVPSEPIIFMKATNSINGPNDDIELEKGSKKLDWEVELGIVIGKETKNISESDSKNHIFGYCLVNDLSEREWQIEKKGGWTKGKSHDTYGPVGPYIVTPDEISNINDLNLSLDVNGKRMQTGNTSKMVFNVYYLVSYLSRFMSLQPGDLITTGTPPGVGMGRQPKVFLKENDKIRLSIDNLGEQNSKVISL